MSAGEQAPFPRPAGVARARPDRRAVDCLDQAMQDVGIAATDPLRQVLHDYFAWATTTTMSQYHGSADEVPDGMSVPRWSWDGLQR